MTRHQQIVMRCIEDFISKNGREPTLDEIAKALSLARSTVHKHIHNLISGGVLNKGIGKKAFAMPNMGKTKDSLPLLGLIAAGSPIEAIPDQQEIDIAANFSGDDRYILKVSGSSMIEVGILDGDYVVLQKQDVAKDGDIVVALINQHEVTLKRLFILDTGNIELRPENAQMEPMFYPADQVQIQGVMVGLFRNA